MYRIYYKYIVSPLKPNNKKGRQFKKIYGIIRQAFSHAAKAAREGIELPEDLLKSLRGLAEDVGIPLPLM